MNKALAGTAAAAVAGAIFWMSSQSATAIGATGLTGMLGTHTDEIAHAVEYCLLGGLVFGGLLVWHQRSTGMTESPLRLVLLGVAAVALVVVFALSDEFHQSFVAGRTTDVQDLIIDAFGSLVGVALYASARTMRRQTVRVR